MTDPDLNPEATSDSQLPTGKDRLIALAAEAQPALVTDARKRKLLEEWKRSGRVVSQARQMLKDAIAARERCAEAVVRRLGRGNLRYDGVLYSPSAKGDTIYLRELVRKPKE